MFLLYCTGTAKGEIMTVVKITIKDLYDSVQATLDKYGVDILEFVYSDRYDWYQHPTLELTDIHLFCADKLKHYIENKQ